MSFSDKHIQIGPYTYPLFQIAFGGLLFFYALLILFTFRSYGITSDETHHIHYGQHIVQWYVSGFQDQTLFQSNNTWLYGGFFDTTAYLFSQILPLDRYDANHLCNALFGLLGLVAAYRIGALLGGPFAGFLAALALFLTPRYYGHAFNNPKDIPFAVCYLWSISYILQCFKTFPNLSYRTLIGTGLSIGFALGIRIGGLLLFAYLGLAVSIQLYHHRQTLLTTLKHILPKLGIIFIIAYLTMLICWPYALQNPLTGPITALQKFSQFTEPHTSFFKGRYVLNTELPRTYAPTWFLLTLPEFALIGLLLGIYFSIALKKLEYLFLLFTGLFPIVYAITFNTPLYDGIRHLLFAMPPLVIFGAIGIYHLIQNPQTQRWGTLIALLLFLGTSIEMIRLHPNQYIFFNTLIAGGLKQASIQYETDYWENTIKQGIRWAEQHTASNNQKVTISGYTENIQYMIDTTRFVSIPYHEKANLYLGTTRYDRHKIVPGEILHTITSAQTPLLYIIRPDTTYRHDPFFADSPFYQFRLGEIHEGEKRPQEALVAFQKSLALTQQTATEPFFLMRIYIRIGNQYESLNQFHKALDTYLKALEYAPQNGALHNNIGIIFARLNDPEESIRWLQKAIKLDPKYFTAYVNLGSIAAQNEQYELARLAYHQALTLKPDMAIEYYLGQLEYELGNYEAAISAYQRILETHPNDPQTLYGLALAYAERKAYAQAQKAIQRAILYAPHDFKNYFTLGSVAMYQNNFQDAKQAYQKAIEIQPQNPDVHVGLGLALAHLGDIPNAQKSLKQALKIQPQHQEAKQHLQTLSR